MQNNYHYQFKRFDPKIGNLPEPYAVMFVELTYRARNILAPYSSKEITAATQAINTIIRDKAFIDPFYEDIKKESIKTKMFGQDYEIVPSTNDIEAIYQNIGRVDLINHISLPGFNWPHVFAAITLFSSELVTDLLHAKASWKPSDILFPAPSDEQITAYVNEFLGDARQAITFAEMLLNQEKNQKRMLSEQNRKAANVRHERASNPLKDAVIEQYNAKYHTRSNRDAAPKIMADLAQDGRLVFDSISHKLFFNNVLALQTDDPEHRFAIWIGKHKKMEQ